MTVKMTMKTMTSTYLQDKADRESTDSESCF